MNKDVSEERSKWVEKLKNCHINRNEKNINIIKNKISRLRQMSNFKERTYNFTTHTTIDRDRFTEITLFP